MSNKKQNTVIDKINKHLEIPNGMLTNSVNMEIHSNKEVIIDGRCTIIEYTDSVIRFNVNTGVIKFCGDSLRIRALTNSNAVITGTICTIDFSN